MKNRERLAIDKTITLSINGSRQHIRLCAVRPGLPPLLVVQAGPALPLLHEVAKFQRLLDLENDFLVAYWEQRGCGDAPAHDARSVSLVQQVDDLRSVLRWLHGETRQRALILGISIGGTITLQAVEHEPDRVRAVIAVSPDAQTAVSDAAAHAFLHEQALGPDRHRIRRSVMALGQPPFVDPAPFQRRARLLADLGTIEHGKTFGALVAGGALRADSHLWRCRRRKSPAQYEYRPAQARCPRSPLSICWLARRVLRFRFTTCSVNRTCSRRLPS